MSAPQFRNPVPADAERCYAIEIGAYEGDEAATLEKIRTRIAQYPEGFLILEAEGEIVGFTIDAPGGFQNLPFPRLKNPPASFARAVGAEPLPEDA